MEWLNRIGIILNFLSFWFVAPDIIGEARLKAWERNLEKAIGEIGPGCLGCSGFAAGCLLSITVFTVFIFIAFQIMARYLLDSEVGVMKSLFVFATIFASGVVCLWQFVRGQEVNEAIISEFIRSVLQRLANEDRIRHRSLLLGIAMFIIGNVLQFVATF